MYRDMFMFTSGFLTASVLSFFIWLFWVVLNRCQGIGTKRTSIKLKPGIQVRGKVSAKNEKEVLVDATSTIIYNRIYVHVEKYGPGQKLSAYDALVPLDVAEFVKIGATYNFYVQENQTLVFRKEDNSNIKTAF